MTDQLFGQLTWLGYRLPIAVPEQRWFDWLTNFTGLEIEPPEDRTKEPVLAVVDDRHILVDGLDLRTFPSLDNLKAWLFLTVSDVIISRGKFTALHAAGFVVGGLAILISGPPWTGKSSWAFEARRRGLEVLGDDQVCVNAKLGTVYALPRPLKLRLLGMEQQLTQQAVRAHLDDEYVALEPRQTNGFARVDRGYSVARIIHLARQNGPGIEARALDQFQAIKANLDQLRAYSAKFLADAAASTRMLSSLPNFHMSVGDGQIARAMDMALALT